MGVGKIVNLLGLAVVIIAGLAGSGVVPYDSLAIIILGAVGGYYVGGDDRGAFLVAAVALSIVHGALGGIPAVGGYIDAILGNLSALYNAGAAAIIILAAYEKATG
ncbi:MAG: hypothetical protein CMQ51_03860 [Gammaproteobacteria bacterium]|jgi:hypothetical protein|nr:hypothetical protein [Gammaproteobacteria bacterium]|tara:strand:+ start:1898 stop:2215 length:318 start_codon:yes stop_codon:yes gene_type:complete